MSLPEAASSGNRIEALRALRDVLASSVVEAEPDKRAPLAARLVEVLEQIDDLTPSAKVGDPVDEIAKRRTARGAGSTKPEGSAAGNQG